MWLPLQLVLEFLGRAAAWLGVMAALGMLVALALTVAFRRPLRSAWPGPIGAGILGALLGASAAVLWKRRRRPPPSPTVDPA